MQLGAIFSSQIRLPVGKGPNHVTIADLNGDGAKDLIEHVRVIDGTGSPPREEQTIYIAWRRA